MIRLMVQGDHSAQGIEGDLRELGTLCKERGIGLNLAEAGEIVRILTGTGAECRIHQAKAEAPNVAPGSFFQVVDCGSPAAAAATMIRNEAPGLTNKTAAWALRLATLIDTSDGFIFFPGAEGTLAHLIPVLAHIKKGEVDKKVARPRRVALVGWYTTLRPSRWTELCDLMSLSSSDGEWIRPFTVGQINDNALDWLTDGLPNPAK